MFVRTKASGIYQYLQIVRNERIVVRTSSILDGPACGRCSLLTRYLRSSGIRVGPSSQYAALLCVS